MPKKTDPTKLKTRPDLSDKEWLDLVASWPENADINVRAIYRRMLDWCQKKGITPTRRRLLVWLDNERDAVPIAPEPPRPAATAPEPVYRCRTCFDTGERTVFPKPNSIEGSYTAPCPDCSTEA